jgi:hypothetical protein
LASENAPDSSANGDSVDVDGVTVPAEAVPDDVPVWDGKYVDRVSDRLMFNYDLEKDRRVRGESFTLYGELSIESQKEFFHPLLNYANHEQREHLFVHRANALSRSHLESLVDLGHELADDWIDADEEHYGTHFTFVVIAPEIPDDVREFVSGFRDRTLLKYGYYGDYEVNLAVVAPEREAAVGSSSADVTEAFRTWEAPTDSERPRGLLARVLDRLGR